MIDDKKGPIIVISDNFGYTLVLVYVKVDDKGENVFCGSIAFYDKYLVLFFYLALSEPLKSKN